MRQFGCEAGVCSNDDDVLCGIVHPIFRRCECIDHQHNDKYCQKSLVLFGALVVLLLLVWIYAWLRRRFTSRRIIFSAQLS